MKNSSSWFFVWPPSLKIKNSGCSSQSIVGNLQEFSDFLSVQEFVASTKIVYVDRVIEKIVEIPKPVEIIKEVIVEKPIEFIR